MITEEIEARLTALKLPHLVVDDCWYSCPKSGDCCDERLPKDSCNCGADDHNAALEAFVVSLLDEVARLDKRDSDNEMETIALLEERNQLRYEIARLRAVAEAARRINFGGTCEYYYTVVNGLGEGCVHASHQADVKALEDVLAALDREKA